MSVISTGHPVPPVAPGAGGLAEESREGESGGDPADCSLPPLRRVGPHEQLLLAAVNMGVSCGLATRAFPAACPSRSLGG